jgi:ABC-type Mn2+/Zn2+ transport system permease subunit
MAQTAQRPAARPSRAQRAADTGPATSSFFFNGHAPRRRTLVAAVAAVFGFALTVVWSAQFVDRTIGDNVADTLLGHAAKGTPIAGVLAGLAFALATGVAGTFTACNVAVFSALAPLAGGPSTSRRGRMAAALRPLSRLALGAVVVSAAYGAVVSLVGTGMPQFDDSQGGGGFSGRLVQAMVVYGLIGLLMTYLGLAALGVVRDPLARLSRRFPGAPMLVMGGLIGAFLIGRPFPLFRQLFRDAAESHNPLYGAVAFGLQSIGNITVMSVLFLLAAGLFGERLHRWTALRPSRASALMAAGFLAAGVFLVLYWDVRILAVRDLIWYPMAPWAK